MHPDYLSRLVSADAQESKSVSQSVSKDEGGKKERKGGSHKSPAVDSASITSGSKRKEEKKKKNVVRSISQI